MASSSADCVLGGVRLISSASRILPKIGPWHERPAAVAGGGIFFDDVRAGDVRGHQVRRELDALEIQAKRLRDGADHQRLRGAGKAGDQAMAADEQRDENLVEHFFLPDDHLADLGEDAVAHRLKAFDALLQFRGIQIDFSGSGHRLFPFLGILGAARVISERGDSRERPRAPARHFPRPCPSGPRRNRPGPD